MMDAVLVQARELRHDIYMLFLDLKQFFPAIKRESRRVAEYFIGLPNEVSLLARAIFAGMRARFDTAHGLSDEYETLMGDLMGCVLSPSHARCLLTSISVARRPLAFNAWGHGGEMAVSQGSRWHLSERVEDGRRVWEKALGDGGIVS